MRYLTIALTKGRLAEKTLEMLEQLGITCEEMKEKDSRKLVFVNEELKLKVNNLAKLVDQGYTTISVYTKKYKSSFGDATLAE